jgi:Mrp family chromosome partitioning ATPase/uncharacterized protein involved in exopolysaccharide biosynthesis
MNTRPKSPTPPPASISMRDIYYVLFRHKWLITILVVLGVGSSAWIYWMYPFPYYSEAELYIKYIQETTAPTAIDGNSSVKSPDGHGDNILNTEKDMIESYDTAEAVVKLLPSNSLSMYDIHANLTADVPPKSDMILLRYSDPNPAQAQRVLISLISAYETNYVKIHMATSMGEAKLDNDVSSARDHLSDTMKTLEDEKIKLNITSLPDAEKNAADSLSRTEESIYQVKTDMAEINAIIAELQPAVTSTNGSSTNQSTNIASAAPSASPSQDVLEKYRSLTAIRTARRDNEQRLLSQFTTNNSLVITAQQQRAAAENEVKNFEAQNPESFAVKSNMAGSPNSPLAASADPMASLRMAQTKKQVLEARLEALNGQLTDIEKKANSLDAAENKITSAETEKEVADAKYKHFLTSQVQASIDATVGDKVSNIITVETPTFGARDGHKIQKAALSILGAFLALAFGLPFLIEMVLDQSFKQPMDVKARIDAPFFLTIPRMNGHHKFPALKQTKPVALLSANGSATPGADKENGTMVLPSTNAPLTSWEERPDLRPFFETLRDRLMTYFEMINLTHKPKLVAVTSCGEGAGVTTTAAGLASSLSEVGEGKVLLVNMNVRDGEAHHFYKGKVACGIEEVLGVEKRDQAQVHEHLYVANEAGSGDSLPRVLPKRFSHLVPLMKASDYDYIIFDMPPVSEISITPRLARFMDMVLLVIESGKTSREAGIHAAALLAESKTNVGLVLNKNRSYLPKRLQNI